MSQTLNEQGKVGLKIWLTAQGTMSDAVVESSSGFPRLDNAAIQFLKTNWSYDPATMAITDWVQITTVGSDSVVKVDTDGTGSGQGWQQIALILGVTGLTDEAALVASGNLVAH